jgi:hypothetical protein
MMCHNVFVRYLDVWWAALMRLRPLTFLMVIILKTISSALLSLLGRAGEVGRSDPRGSQVYAWSMSMSHVRGAWWLIVDVVVMWIWREAKEVAGRFRERKIWREATQPNESQSSQNSKIKVQRCPASSNPIIESIDKD